MLPMFIRRMIHDLQERRRIVREARTRIGELVGNDPVIEIGCGFGPNSDFCGGAYLGIDVSHDAVREAKRRHPTKHFLCGDIMTAVDEAAGYNTVLLCAVLHEMADFADVLGEFTHTGIHRILVCDYDPELSGWLRLWMNLFEPDARRWWGCDPGLLLPQSEWSFRSGQITHSLLWWEFTRKNRPANPTTA
jgi:hypothetical protein